MRHSFLYAATVAVLGIFLCLPANQTIYATEVTASAQKTSAAKDGAAASAQKASAAKDGAAASAQKTSAAKDGAAASAQKAGAAEDGAAEDKATTPIPLSDCTISLSKTVYTYTGKEKTPVVTATYNGKKLKKNTDFTVSYSYNTDVGVATATIKGSGRFRGTVKKTFTIFPKMPASVKATVCAKAIDITWKPSAQADEYIIYKRKAGESAFAELAVITDWEELSYTDEDCEYGVNYEYCVRASVSDSDGTFLSDYSKVASRKFQPQAPVITDLMPLSKDSFSVTWDLQNKADGYILYQKVDGKWKKIKTIAASHTNHYTVKKLTYKKTYTFALRAYWKAEDGTIQKGALSKPFKEKLSYKAEYVGQYKFYYDAGGDLITNVDQIIGPQKKYTYKINRITNTVTAYTDDPKKKGYTIPVTTFLCSTGEATPIGTFTTTDKYRWHPLFHNVFGQWCTRITKNILFHSVYYLVDKDPNSLDPDEFNKLGTAASAGCIRLCCRDVIWVYDRTPKGTEVVIYDDPSPGPFGIPTMMKLPPEHTWDPTDPDMKYLCKENGCHQE